MGAHHPRHAAPGTAEASSPRMRRLALAVVVPLALVTLGCLVWLWPGSLPGPDTPGSLEQVEGVVTAVSVEQCPESAATGGTTPDPAADPASGAGGATAASTCGTATVRLTSGADDGLEVETPLPTGAGAVEVGEGDDVLLVELGGARDPDGSVDESAPPSYSIVDRQRGTGLAVLVGAFALAVVAFGRLRGLTALLGLGVTFGLLVWFVVPAILAGESPLLVAIVGSAAIVLTVLYLTHGPSLSTTVAVVGTIAALTLTGLLSALSVAVLGLTGVSDDLSSSLGTTYGVNVQGVLLAGIVIGSLGVLDDVTVTQAATVEEIARANPGYGARELYRAATRVGRSHIASVINTIVLAYAGSALPLLILVVATDDPLGDVVTDQVIAQEVVRSVVATFGLMAAVPITTALAALAVREARQATRQPTRQPTRRSAGARRA